MSEIDYAVDINYSEKGVEQFFTLIDEHKKYLFYKRIKGKDKEVFIVREFGSIVAVFVFLVLTEEGYMEMLFHLQSNQKAFDIMLKYLKKNYHGYHCDFVFDKDEKMINSLKQCGASFEKEQYTMKLVNFTAVAIKHKIVAYSNEYKSQYCNIHSNDVYWLAQKVIYQADQFRIFLCVEDNEVVGYVDMTYCFTVNEPFDVFVKEEYRNRGICKELLSVAIDSNENKNVELMVDYDNIYAIKAYKSLGFELSERLTVTAHLEL